VRRWRYSFSFGFVSSWTNKGLLMPTFSSRIPPMKAFPLIFLDVADSYRSVDLS